MRNLNECQAEVFRRSEKIIKQRKQRKKRMLMGCIPLVLCITMFSGLFLPGMKPTGSAAPCETEAAMGGLTEEVYENLARTIARIEVSGFGFSQTYTDAFDILLISDQLYSCGVCVPESNGATYEGTLDETVKENTDGSDGIADVMAGSADTGYTITLVMCEGSKTVYCLSGNMLTNQMTNQTYTLSQKQTNELKDLLGIPQP